MSVTDGTGALHPRRVAWTLAWTVLLCTALTGLKFGAFVPNDSFRAGWNSGETSEDFAVSYEVAPAPLAPGTYRQITGNTALAYGGRRAG